MRHRLSDAQGSRDAATLLPIAATILLLPPFILLFATPIFVRGVPLIVAYVFGVWAAVIFAAWLIARRQAELSRYSVEDQKAAPPAADQH